MRVLNEQTIYENGKRRLKEKNEAGVNSDMLQSPYDEDATFRRKQGKTNHGYSCNFVETVNEGKSVITDYQYGKNNISDNAYGKEAIANIEMQDEEAILVADGAYCGNKLIRAAKEKNISIINTNLTGRKPRAIDAEFTITDNSVICPNGNRPESISVSNEIYHLKFRCSVCENCPKREECNPHFVPGYAIRNISETRIQRAEQMKFRGTEEFRKYSAIKNGVESIPSVMRRKYKADKMPVRELIKTKLWFGLKIAVFNFTKLCSYEQGLRKASKNEIKAII